MKLSKEQEIYFKDSKVRDKDGNLLVCYHGDDNDFNEFKKEFIGSKSLKYAVPNVGVFGEGFYFTNESHKASRYGKVKEYYLNIKNPFIFKDYNSQEKIDALKKETDIDDIETTYNAFFDEYRVSYIDSVDSQKKFTQFLKEKGYDGIIYSDIDTFDKELEIIAFESNQIKSVDNLNPTNSNNINEAFIDDVHFDVKFQDLDLDKLESEIIDAMSDYDSEYFDDDEWHVPNYEFIERGFILRDGSEIDTGGYRHYNLEAKIRDWLMFDKHVDLSILNNTVIHKVTNALCWIRVNGLNEDYICLPTKRPNDTQLHTLEKWIDDFFRERNYQAGLRVTVGDGKQQVTYAPELTGKEIVDKIKRYYNNNVLTEKELNESLLLEKNRQELITKSKAGAEYASKARKGQNRWTRRKYSSVANSIRDYNNINMDVFFKDDILEFVVKVHGETDDYEVTITFADILRNLQQEIERNNNKLEFKCVLRALLTSFNSKDLFVSCTCLHPDTKIKLLDGTTPTVKEMCDRFNAGEKLWVYSTDEKGDFKPGEVEKVWMTKIAKEFIKVTLDNGEEILTTPEHPYMLRDGSYKFAEDLSVGQSLMPMYFNETNGYETVKLNSKTRGWWVVYKLVAECLKSEEMQKAEERADLEDSSMPYKVAVHHADFNKRNNTPDNLKIMTANEHWQYHASLCGENRPITERMREASTQNAIKRNANPTENMKRARQEWLNKGIAHNYDPEWKPIQAEIMRNAIKKYHENMTEDERKKFSQRSSEQMKNLWSSGRIQTEKYWNARKHGFDNIVRDDNYYKKSYTSKISQILQEIIDAGKIPSPEVYEEHRKEFHKFSVKWTAVFNTWEELSTYFNLNHKVVKIERVILEDTPVYDIKVKDWHNFVVDAGVVLHNCPDFIYAGFNYYGVKQNYNSKPILGKALQAPRIKNPLDNKGSCCKHINLVISNTDWMMKVASVINNYIKWCKENMSRNYADIIFPAVYGVSYKGAIQMSLFDDPDDNGLLPSDQGTISKVIDRTMSARDTKGKFVQGNEYRFKKQDTIKAKQQAQEDNEGQLKLDLDTIKKKSRQDTIKRKQIVPEVEITDETEIEEK